MMTLFLIAGLIVGALVGYKLGNKKGQSQSWIIVQIKDLQEIINRQKETPEADLVMMTREGWELFEDTDD